MKAAKIPVGLSEGVSFVAAEAPVSGTGSGSSLWAKSHSIACSIFLPDTSRAFLLKENIRQISIYAQE